MSKIKTHKATAKRFIITKKGKIRRRKAGQDHFNAREAGAITRAKRLDTGTTETNAKNLRKMIPYN